MNGTAAHGIKIQDIAFARLRAPDLDKMEEFLTDFGLIRVHRDAEALYMRGTDAPHHIHVTHRGPAAFVGFAFRAPDEAALEAATRIPGASGIEKLDEPGGGLRVRLTEPNGYQIEIVWDMAEHEPIEVKRLPLNTGSEPLNRAGVLMRLPKGPTPVKRIAHGVIASSRTANTVGWFRRHLGLICSDDVYEGERDNIIASFNRADRGDEYVDHHVFACMNVGDAVGLHHISFEMPDVDGVFADHHYLRAIGKYEHVWGIGRHTVGSQIFDYWADPWGRLHEHWSDSDRLKSDSGSFLWLPEEALESQWGEKLPLSMRRASP